MLKIVYTEDVPDSDLKVVVYAETEREGEREVGSDRRVRERDCAVWGVNDMLGRDDLTIGHTAAGAPFIEQLPELQLSVSHSNDLYALAISTQQQVGIDVQHIRPGKLHRGRAYYVNDQEDELFVLDEHHLHVIWSTKEAMYKRLKGGIERYKEGMTVTSISEEDVVVEVDGLSHRCYCRNLVNAILVFTLD